MNFLYRFLNKNLVKHQVLNYKSKDFVVMIEKIIIWLLDIYKYINDYVKKLGFPEHLLCNDNVKKYFSCEIIYFYLAPFIFMDIPFSVDKSETWFIQLWNYTIIPYLTDLTKEKLKVSFSHFLFIIKII